MPGHMSPFRCCALALTKALFPPLRTSTIPPPYSIPLPVYIYHLPPLSRPLLYISHPLLFPPNLNRYKRLTRRKLMELASFPNGTPR